MTDGKVSEILWTEGEAILVDDGWTDEREPKDDDERGVGWGSAAP